MVNQGNPMREFEGKSHALEGPLPGGTVKPRQMTFTRAEGQRPQLAAPTPVMGERFAGQGGTLAAPAPAAAPQPAAPAARAPLGAPKKGYDIVLKAVQPNGQETVLKFRAVIPADAKITELDAWE